MNGVIKRALLKESAPDILGLCCLHNQTKGKELEQIQKLSHTISHCEYHIVWVPKYRYRVLQGKIKKQVDQCVREQTQQMKYENTINPFPRPLTRSGVNRIVITGK